jgi:hypothetical protein
MKSRLATLALIALPLIAACGSTQSSSPAPVTVTVTTSPPAPTTTATPPPPTTTTTTTTATTTTTTPTRTSPAPAFTRTTGGTPAGGDLGAAVAKVRALGFTPLSTATYDSGETLRVLVGARTGSAGAHTQQAFFFDEARYLGTDASAPSGEIAVTGHGDTTVTLRYGIYRRADPDCCPTGTPRAVDFTLDGGHLVAVDAIPSVTDRR